MEVLEMLIVEILVILGLVVIFTDSILVPFLEKKFPFFIIEIGDAMFNYGEEKINRKKIEKLLQEKRTGLISDQQLELLYELLTKTALSNPESCEKCYYEDQCEKKGYCKELELFHLREDIGITLKRTKNLDMVEI